MSCEGRSRDQGDAARDQEMHNFPENQQKQMEKPGQISPSESPERTNPAATLILDIQPLEFMKTKHFCSVSHFICDTWL